MIKHTKLYAYPTTREIHRIKRNVYELKLSMRAKRELDYSAGLYSTLAVYLGCIVIAVGFIVLCKVFLL